MNRSPLISIITVIKGDVTNLLRTLDSLASQHQDVNYEWIVIDGSAESFNLSSSIASIANFRYFHGQDNGIYHAMNIGLSNALGKYINFLNAGDTLYSSESLLRVADILEFREVGALFLGSLSCFGNTRVPRSPSRYIHRQHETMPSSHQATFYNRNLLATYSLNYDTSYRICGDYDLYHKFLAVRPDVEYIDLPYVVFDTEGISSLCPVLLWQESSKISFKYLSFFSAIIASSRCLLSVALFQIVRFLNKLF